MINSIFMFLYNLLVAPVLIKFFHIAAILNPKIRKGVLGRYQVISKVREFISDIDVQSASIFLFHCASMGEFEHIKPLLIELKNRVATCKIVVMFFSPSGYENVKSAPGVDLFIYTPFDWWFPVHRLFRELRPRALLIAKHDVWPNQIWAARRLGIPRFLINATLYKSSRRLRPLTRWFLRPFYHQFTRILTISGQDKENYQKLADASRIDIVGDTKFDQVVFRSVESQKKVVLPAEILRSKQVFVAGSTWPEDEAYLIPALKKLVCSYPKLLTIICPHEPTAEHLQQLTTKLAPLQSCLYSELDAYQGQPIIIIDKIGLLANLYSAAHVAYVGGSFKQNIHNVLEPAVYGIPVLFGPVNENSYEAQLLKQEGGGLEVHSQSEIENHLQRILDDESYRLQVGRAAKKLVTENQGATQRTVTRILQFIERV